MPFEDLGKLVWLATTTVISMNRVALSVAGAFHSGFDPVYYNTLCLIACSYVSFTRVRTSN